jgi:hypothetical protein
MSEPENSRRDKLGACMRWCHLTVAASYIAYRNAAEQMNHMEDEEDTFISTKENRLSRP